jgi:K+-transporting ATPase KdpF subunit
VVLRESPLTAPHILQRIPTMETILIGLIAVACLAYLVVAVLRPEKF